MAKKQFKAESKRLLDLMINSIYTHQEIFLREIISNASDAIDKLAYQALTDENVGLSRSDFAIELKPDETARTLTVSDNGIGMDKDEMENNLGTICRSGSLQFKQALDKEKAADTDIIGQFGVGFYSAFMVADKVTVISKKYGSDEAWKWESEGADGYTMTPCERASRRYGRDHAAQGRHGRREIRPLPEDLGAAVPCPQVFRLHPLPHPHGGRKKPHEGGHGEERQARI